MGSDFWPWQSDWGRLLGRPTGRKQHYKQQGAIKERKADVQRKRQWSCRLPTPLCGTRSRHGTPSASEAQIHL